MYPLMQTGKKWGHYNPLPIGITPSSVFQYIGIHIQFAHQNFKILQICPTLNYLLELSGPSPLSFHNFLLLPLNFWLIPKLRKFVATTLFMFPHWVVPA